MFFFLAKEDTKEFSQVILGRENKEVTINQPRSQLSSLPMASKVAIY